MPSRLVPHPPVRAWGCAAPHTSLPSPASVLVPRGACPGCGAAPVREPALSWPWSPVPAPSRLLSPADPAPSTPRQHSSGGGRGGEWKPFALNHTFSRLGKKKVTLVSSSINKHGNFTPKRGTLFRGERYRLHHKKGHSAAAASPGLLMQLGDSIPLAIPAPSSGRPIAPGRACATP